MPRRARLRLDPLEGRSVPAVLTVTTAFDAGPGSLREAVTRANDEANYPGPDVIRFAPNMFGPTAWLSTAADTSLGPSALAITSTVTIDGFTGYPGGGPGITIARWPTIDNLRLFLVDAGGDLTLDGVTLDGGMARGGNGHNGSRGPGGGGAGMGGAVFNRGQLTVSRSLLVHNQAIGGIPGGYYVGIMGYPWYGAGGDPNGGPAGVAGGFGGGGGGPSAPGGFGGGAGGQNGAGMGAAVFNDDGTVTVVNSTFANNWAYGSWYGHPDVGLGTLFNLNGAVTVTNSTFSGNTGGAVSVLAHDASGGVGNTNPAGLLLVNSILTGSVGGSDLSVTQLAGSGGATVVAATPNAVGSVANAGGTVVDSGVLHADPSLFPLADNGGPTRTMTPAATGPAHDAGWSAYAPAGTDQRGDGYQRRQGPAVDLGAVELPFTPAPLAVTASNPAAGDTVLRLFDPFTGQPVRQFVPFPTFGGVVHVAVGDVTGDGVPDIVAGAGPGGGPHVKVFDGATGAELMSFYAFDPAFRGGVSVAVGDMDGDRTPDLITGAGPGGGPHVKAFRVRDGAEIASFYAFDPGFAGGVSVAAADFFHTGTAEIVAAAGAGGGPHVRVFAALGTVEVASFYAYAEPFAGGVSVAAGDVTGDGVPDIVTGTGAGGGPHVKAFDGRTGAELTGFNAYDPAFVGGVDVAARDLNGDGREEVITGAGPGGGPNVKVFDGRSLLELASFFPLDESFHGGVLVG